MKSIGSQRIEFWPKKDDRFEDYLEKVNFETIDNVLITSHNSDYGIMYELSIDKLKLLSEKFKDYPDVTKLYQNHIYSRLRIFDKYYFLKNHRMCIDYISQLNDPKYGVLINEKSRDLLNKFNNDFNVSASKYSQQMQMSISTESEYRAQLKDIIDSPHYWRMFMDAKKGYIGPEASEHIDSTGWLLRATREYDALPKFKNIWNKLLVDNQKLSYSLLNDIACSLWSDSFENSKLRGIGFNMIQFGGFSETLLEEELKDAASELMVILRFFSVDNKLLLNINNIGSLISFQKNEETNFYSIKQSLNNCINGSNIIKYFFDGIFEAYYKFLETQPDTESILHTIAKITLSFGWMHPTFDCTGRVIIKTMMQNMLLHAGLSPIFWSYGIGSTFNNSTEELVEFIKKGQEEFRNLYQDFKNGTLNVKHEKILKQILDIPNFKEYALSKIGSETNKNAFHIPNEKFLSLLDTSTLGKDVKDLSDKEKGRIADIIKKRLNEGAPLPNDLLEQYYSSNISVFANIQELEHIKMLTSELVDEPSLAKDAITPKAYIAGGIVENSEGIMFIE